MQHAQLIQDKQYFIIQDIATLQQILSYYKIHILNIKTQLGKLK